MPSKVPTGGIKTREIWIAPRLARDTGNHDWGVIADLVSLELGRPIHRTALRETCRKGRQPSAGAARRLACEALEATRQWAKSPASGPPPELPNQPPPPLALIDYKPPEPEPPADPAAALAELVANLETAAAALARSQRIAAALAKQTAPPAPTAPPGPPASTLPAAPAPPEIHKTNNGAGATPAPPAPAERQSE